MCVYCLSCNPCSPLRRRGSVPSWPPRWQLQKQWALPFALSRQNKPWSLRLIAHHTLQPQNNLHGPPLGLTKNINAFSSTGQPHTGHRTLHAISQPEQRETIPSLDPLPTQWLQSSHSSRFKPSATFFFSYNYAFAQNEAVSRNNWTKKTRQPHYLVLFPEDHQKSSKLTITATLILKQHCPYSWLLPLPTASIPCASNILLCDWEINQFSREKKY